MDSGLQTFPMEPDDDNVINVPFRLMNEIYEVRAKGGDVDVIAIACGTTEPVINAIFKAQRRKRLRAKFMESFTKAPA
jgi:predicted ThiF/HesA family dinucleotide-utilizing enzyme